MKKVIRLIRKVFNMYCESISTFYVCPSGMIPIKYIG